MNRLELFPALRAIGAGGAFGLLAALAVAVAVPVVAIPTTAAERIAFDLAASIAASASGRSAETRECTRTAQARTGIEASR